MFNAYNFSLLAASFITSFFLNPSTIFSHNVMKLNKIFFSSRA